MTDKDKMRECACGAIPNELFIVDGGQGGKWAWAYGGCCGEWHIEFRTEYNELESEKCKDLAQVAWNSAPRAAKESDRKELEAAKQRITEQNRHVKAIQERHMRDSETIEAMEKKLAEQQEMVRDLLDEIEKMRESLIAISSRNVICGSRGDFRDGQLVALETCRKIANNALTDKMPSPEIAMNSTQNVSQGLRMKANDGKLLELEHLFCETLPVGGEDEKGNKLTPYYCMNDVAAWAVEIIESNKVLKTDLENCSNGWGKVPEGCTPEDAMVLRRANHELADEMDLLIMQINTMRKALDTAEQANNEISLAYTDPNFFTHGIDGARKHFFEWLNKSRQAIAIAAPTYKKDD